MVTAQELLNEFDNVFKEIGNSIRIKYYNVNYGAGSYYDDDVTYTRSGNDYWCSGAFSTINSKRGSYEALLVEQGKLLNSDSIIYIKGYVNTSGTLMLGLGSPVIVEYKVVENGVTAYQILGSVVYKKLYVSILTNGSFF